MIRVSIIGHELSSNYSLLDWFLNSDGTVNGYDDHYWNGVTTLAWAKICSSIMNNWDTVPTLNQYANR
jgi:dTDP-4-dehydrorhamnose reductase